MILPWRKKDRNEFDIALVMCPGWGVIQPPVGISYLKSFLISNGVSAKCFDFSLDFYKEFKKKEYWELNYPEHFVSKELFEKDILPHLQPYLLQWAKRIIDSNPKIVGFSLFMSSLNASLVLAKLLKQMRPDIMVIAGGAEVSRVKRILVDGIGGYAPANREIFSTFDMLVDGEGEKTLLELILKKKQHKNVRDINGIVYQQGNQVIVNKQQELLKNLDSIPSPRFDDYILERYIRKELPLVTSRGCVNRCTFCTDSPLWKTYRVQSAAKVFDVMQKLIADYGRTQFEIVDSTFNGDIPRVYEICDMLIESKIPVRWSAKVTLNKGLTYELLKKMKQAGCSSLAYGVESGSPRVLKDMRKNIDLEETEKILEQTYQVGIEPNCFFIIGYPTETEEDFQMTLDFIKKNARFIHRFDQVTGCHIEEDSYLGLNYKEYGIEFKADGWHSAESTPKIRRERLKRFEELARRLHEHYTCEAQE